MVATIILLIQLVTLVVSYSRNHHHRISRTTIKTHQSNSKSFTLLSSSSSSSNNAGDPYPDQPLSFSVLEGQYSNSIVAPLTTNGNNINDDDSNTNDNDSSKEVQKPVFLARFISWILKKIVQAKTKFVEVSFYTMIIIIVLTNHYLRDWK